MVWLAILVIGLVVLYFGALIASYIYKRKHNIPVGECAHCAKRKQRLVKEYRKAYNKN
ncbi:MAG: hypothetical protein K6E11_03015 [Bacilli bacterium]|nr:hypothetical protein [Bacilli bacterium]